MWLDLAYVKGQKFVITPRSCSKAVSGCFRNVKSPVNPPSAASSPSYSSTDPQCHSDGFRGLLPHY